MEEILQIDHVEARTPQIGRERGVRGNHFRPDTLSTQLPDQWREVAVGSHEREEVRAKSIAECEGRDHQPRIVALLEAAAWRRLGRAENHPAARTLERVRNVLQLRRDRRDLLRSSVDRHALDDGDERLEHVDVVAGGYELAEAFRREVVEAQLRRHPRSVRVVYCDYLSQHVLVALLLSLKPWCGFPRTARDAADRQLLVGVGRHHPRTPL